MGKKKYYISESEKKVAYVKLFTMDEEKATMLFETFKLKNPPQRLLANSVRGMSYNDVPLSTLEYLWIGCEKSDLKTRIRAKASYLVRCNEYNHPRLKLMLSYRENMDVLRMDENILLKTKSGLTYEEPKNEKEEEEFIIPEENRVDKYI